MSAIVRSRTDRQFDRRARRSRSAILAAFNRLILEQGYAGLTPGEVAAAADVGRSTFYEHFSGLDELLAQTLGPVLTPLVDGCLDHNAPDAALKTLEHLWENRRLARALLTGDAYVVVLRIFAFQFTSAVKRNAQGSRIRLEPELIGLQLAAGQLALLSAWLLGRSGHSAGEIADALHASGKALLTTMLQAPPPFQSFGKAN